MNKMKRTKWILTAMLSMTILLTGCGGNAASGGNGAGQPAANQGEVVTNGIVNFPIVADPIFNPLAPTGYVESQPVTELMFDGLTRWGTDFQPIPSLAKDWAVSEDGLTWTFNLQDKATWHDGQPFGPDDVLYTFNEIVLNKDMGSNNASNFTAVEKVVKSGDNQIQFILKQPWSSLPNYLAYHMRMVPAHIFKGQDPWKLTSFNKENPIGTGPYKLSKYTSGQNVELVRYDGYYGGTAASVEKIIAHIVPDTNTQIAQMLSGTLNLLSIKDPNLLDPLEKNKNLKVAQSPDNTYFWAALNHDQERFQSVQLKQALLHAIDREAIIAGVLKGYGKVATGPITPMLEKFYTSDVKQYAYDPELSKKLLQEAGYTMAADGFMQKDGKTLELRMVAGQYGNLVAISELVQQYWQKVGVKVNLEVKDWNTYIQEVVIKRNYDVTICWWTMPVDPDILSFYASEAAGSGSNIPNYKNPKLDEMMKAGRQAKTEEERIQIYKDIQKLLAEELPYMYLWYPQGALVVQNNLEVPSSSFTVAEDHVLEWKIRK